MPQSNYMGGWFRSISNSMGGGLMSLYAEGKNITCQKKKKKFYSEVDVAICSFLFMFPW